MAVFFCPTGFEVFLERGEGERWAYRGGSRGHWSGMVAAAAGGEGDQQT